ncbi:MULTISPECIES: Rz1 lytic protein [Escherichia]|nr:Rz1 lytic protein [Escherichia coli]
MSRWLLRLMIALTSLCLLVLLTGCVTTRTVYVPVPHVQVPDSLTAETPQPEIPPGKILWKESLTLNAKLLAALEMCNQDKRDIRHFDQQRNAEYLAEK